jgi:hypothetical protein
MLEATIVIGDSLIDTGVRSRHKPIRNIRGSTNEGIIA